MKIIRFQVVMGLLGLVLLVGAIFQLNGMVRDLNSLETALNEVGTPGSSAIAEARSREIEFNLVQDKALALGLSCLASGTEICAKMIARVEENPQLKVVFLQAKAANVLIIPSGNSGSFRVGEGYISIDPGMSDGDLIALLTK